MDNNFDNTLKDTQPVYTDPNADVKPEPETKTDTGTQEQTQNTYQYTQSNPQNDSGTSYAGYRQGEFKNSNYDQYQSGQNSQSNQNNQNYDRYQYTQGYQQYQDNLDYNIGNHTSYQQNDYNGMDTSPMSMGDWVLTILAAMIPCAGIILYIVWAFSSNGNVNRRNFCRAQLVIMAVVLVLYLILFLVFGVAMMGTFGGM